MPGFCSPMALSIPEGVSMMRGIGLPLRRRGVIPLLTKAPRRCTSMTPAYSSPYPKHPEAAMIGLRNVSSLALAGARSTVRSTPDSEVIAGTRAGERVVRSSPDHLVEVKDRALNAGRRVTMRSFDDAAETGADSARHVPFDRDLHLRVAIET